MEKPRPAAFAEMRRHLALVFWARTPQRQMRNLKLEKPVAFIDLETTGLSPSVDRIVELSVLKVHPDGREEVRNVRVNPEMPIPASATRIHGITDEDVVDKAKFRQYAAGIRAFLDDCDIGGFGVKRFDLPFLEVLMVTNIDPPSGRLVTNFDPP